MLTLALNSVGRLYRGLVPPLMLEAPKRAVKFAANDFWGKTYRGFTGQDKMTQSLSVLTGCSAGATESIVVVPFELVKIRLQVRSTVELIKLNRADVVLFKGQGTSASIQRPNGRSRQNHRKGRHVGHVQRLGEHLLAARTMEWRLLWVYLSSAIADAKGRGKGTRASK